MEFPIQFPGNPPESLGTPTRAGRTLPRNYASAHPNSSPRGCLAILLALSLLATPVLAAPSLETFVITAGGRANATFNPPCTSGGSPTPVFDFFGVWGVGVPTAGLDSCNIAGGITDETALNGPLTRSRTLSSSWPAIPANFFSGSATGTANYGGLAAKAHAQFNGEDSNLNSTGCDGFGLADDGFTITSPSFANGVAGTLSFRITLTGAFSTTSLSQVGVHLANRVNTGQLYTLFQCYGFYASQNPSIYSWGGDDLSGLTLSPGALSGSVVISSAALPMVFGTQYNYKFGLLVEAVPGQSSTVDSDFRAAITGIIVKGPAGETVSSFVVTSASGTPYSASGVTAVDGLPPARVDDTATLTARPNPARAGVELRFALTRPAASRLEIFDSTGRRLRGLGEAQAVGGVQSARWDGRDESGIAMPSGVYFARLTWPGGSTTTRLTLLH